MGDGERILLTPWAEAPYSYGFEGGAGFQLGIPTVVSDFGLGVDAELRFLWSDRSNLSYFIDANYLYQDLEKKLFTDTNAEGGSVGLDLHSFKFGFGKRTRAASFATTSGHKWGSFAIDKTPFLGGGQLTIPSFSRSIEGEEGSELLEGESSGFFNMGSTSGFGIELRPIEGSRFQLTIMPNFTMGYMLSGNPELNRLYLNLGINLYFGFADMSANTSRVYSMTDHAFAVYKELHSFGMRFMADAVMNRYNDLLGESGLLGESTTNNRDMTEQIRMISVLSAFTSSSTIDAFMETGDIRWLYFGLGLLTGTISLAAGQSLSTQGAGAGDLIGTTGYLLNTAWGVDTEAKRLAFGDDLDKRMASAYGTRLAFNSAFFLTSLILGDTRAGNILASAGGSANVDLATNPAPGTDEAPYVTHAWIPHTGYFGKHSGGRAGYLMDVTWGGDLSWLYSQTRLLSHGFTLPNLGNRFTEDEPYADSILPSSIETTFGAQYSSKYFRIGGGIDFARHFGGPDFAGLGLSARLLLRIPIVEQLAFVAGVTGSFHVNFPTTDISGEVSPYTGVELFNW